MTEVVTAVSPAAGANAREANPGFGVYDSEFAAALGPAPRLALVAETDAHEGPVYIPGEDVLYFTSLPGKQISPHSGPRVRTSSGSLWTVSTSRWIPRGCRSYRRLCICPTA